jgi:L-alanine-DL-glutamate epimerase-like enolase superfamily enzyme
LTKLQAFVLRCPSPVPVRTSFGIMRERPAVFVHAESADGAVGWGEIWCNFPACGAEHRAFKLKIGFSDQQDLDHLASLRAWLGPQADLMADVNQAWDLPKASAMLPRLEPLGLAWRSPCAATAAANSGSNCEPTRASPWRPALLPALPRCGHRPDGLGPRAGCRRRRRPA